MASNRVKIGINFRVDQADLRRMDKLSRRMGISRSEAIRRAMIVGADELERAMRMGKNPVGRAALTLLARIDGRMSPAERVELLRLLRRLADEEDARAPGTLPYPEGT